MTFDADYVLERYQYQAEGISYVYYPAAHARRLLVTFAALNEGGLYNRIEHFWQQDESWNETAYLFFADPSNQWYADLQPYRSVISATGIADVYVSGSCMGADAALRCGLECGYSMLLTAVRNKDDIANPHGRYEQRVYPKLGPCYIEARGTGQDAAMLQYVADLYQRRGGLCLARTLPQSPEHWAIDLWNPSFTLRLLDIFDEWSNTA